MVVVPRNIRSKDKIYKSTATLRAVLQSLQAQDRSVALSNGVFDLLHVGHTRCLEDARHRADFLVVAVNSDRSAEINKGKGHPIVPCAERMELLAALWFVDYVVPFEGATADELLVELQPDLYAKGTDYTASTLPEKATLKRLDIKPVFVGDKKAHSTSKLIQKIRRKKL